MQPAVQFGDKLMNVILVASRLLSQSIRNK